MDNYFQNISPKISGSQEDNQISNFGCPHSFFGRRGHEDTQILLPWANSVHPVGQWSWGPIQGSLTIQYLQVLFTALRLEQRKEIRCRQQLQGASLTYKLEQIRCVNASFTKSITQI